MKYIVGIKKKDINFSSSHFIIEGEKCERIHGHNYNTFVEIEGPLDETGYVVDFMRLKSLMKEIVTDLDHKILLPSKNPHLETRKEGGEIEVSFKQKRYVFPQEECIFLPIPNCTSEHMAAYLLSLLKSKLISEGYDNIKKISLGVEESEGQWGVVEEEVRP